MIVDIKSRNAKDVPSHTLTLHLARHLKEKNVLATPKWADYAKTASFKELAPSEADWLYARAAALLRLLHGQPYTGVGAFRRRFGGRSRRAMRKRHFRRAAGGHLRFLLQQLEKAKLVKRAATGRRITREGQRVVDSVANQVPLETPALLLNSILMDEEGDVSDVVEEGDVAALSGHGSDAEEAAGSGNEGLGESGDEEE